jgi:hypothetical protein
MPDGTQVRELDYAEPGTTVGSGGAVAAKAVEKTAFGAGMMRRWRGTSGSRSSTIRLPSAC